MIESGFLYVSVLIAMAALVIYADRGRGWTFFKYVPGVVMIYILGATFNTIGLFGESEALGETYSLLRDALLPAMIFLLLFSCDLRKIAKLGPKMIIAFFVGTFSIVIGFALTYLLLQSFYAADTWQGFAALAGSWTGGSANMAAIQGILDVPEGIFGQMLIVDTIDYSIWLMMLFWMVPFAAAFNRWTKADTSAFEEMSARLEEDASAEQKSIDLVQILGLIGGSLLVSAIATSIGEALPEIGDFINPITWTILIVSILGLIVALTPLGKTAGSMEIGSAMLYIIIALIASRADFSQITEVPIYLLSGLLVLFIHGVVMLLFAKLFKVDLFTMGISSLANVGGMASAPVLAGAFSKNLVPIGVIMALMGSFFGTYAGLFVGWILERL
ncbi:DUF819 family protein [Shouchella shacheensis]|uniref:DUF819 family protein n=1 Tax=Shouchella shacheensis TaxID=1649580 RepID=UPI00073FFC96|nr:DUF819 family protein [Shouchella shacheensis]